jgi:S1-C subfamily serine protease
VVKVSTKFLLFLLITMALILVISACSQRADDSIAPPQAIVDTGQVADMVLEEVGIQLTAESATQAEASAQVEEPNVGDTSLDVDTIVETVVARLEEKEEAEEQTLPVAFGNDALEQAAQSLESSLINIYQQANPAVVFIIVPPIGSGSGFVIDKDGYIVTNNHVVAGGRDYEVVFASGERRRARLVGQDIDSDLAVIQVDELPAKIEPLVLGSSDDLAVGQLVAAIGNPFGEQGSMSLGIISGLDRALQSDRDLSTGNSYSLPQVIQTDAPINPGNSGGPLLNLKAEVIGVNSAIATRTGTNSGVGFSIPVDAVKQIVPDLIEKGFHDYPFMGIGFDGAVTLDEKERYGLSQTQGAYVLNVTEGGPADLAGLIAANPTSGRGGDLIIAIDNVSIEDFDGLNSFLVFHTDVGQLIEITLLRDGEEIELELTLGSRP